MVTGKDPFYEKALAEHRELCRLLGAIENKLNTASAAEQSSEFALHELQELFEGLLVHVREHFAEEEAGGLLEEAICRLPRLGPQATALERQHEPLLRQLCQIVERARDCGSPSELKTSAAGEFRKFVQALMTHEAAENRLAEEAFNGEILCEGS